MVRLSATHTEIVSLSECIRALVPLRRLAEECGFIVRTPSRVDCDNEVATKSSKLRTNSDKSWTIRLRDFHCREAVSRGEVRVEFMKGTDTDADIFTKAKGDPAFAKMAERLKQGHRGVSQGWCKLLHVVGFTDSFCLRGCCSSFLGVFHGGCHSRRCWM